MYKAIEISGIKYIYDNKLYVCVVSATNSVATTDNRCYYHSGLEHRLLVDVGSISCCKSEMRLFVCSLCKDPVFHRHDIDTDNSKEEGIYDGEQLNYRVHDLEATMFSFNGCNGWVKPIDCEIAAALEYGCARQFMEAVYRVYSVVTKEAGGKSFIAFANDRYPLIPNKVEYDMEECREWIKWGNYPLHNYPWHRKVPKPNNN